MNLKLPDIFDSAKVILFYLTKDYEIIKFNQEAKRFFDRLSNDAIGKNFINLLIPKENRDSIQNSFGIVLKEKDSITHKIPLVDNSGKIILIEWNITRLVNNNGEIIGLLVIGYEISHIRMRDIRIYKSEQNYKMFLDNFQGIAYQAFLGTYKPIFIMGKIEEITGYTSEDFLEERIRWNEIVHPDDQSKLDENIKKMVKNVKNIEDYEYRIYQKNGNIRWVRDISSKIFNFDLNELILQGSIYDITDQKEIEKELKMQKALHESIFRAAPTGIGRVVNRIFTEVNDRFCELTGYSREELIGKSARMIYPTDQDYEYVGQEKYDQINKYGIGTVETRFKRKNNKIIEVLLSSSPIDNGDLSKGVTFTALDITMSKKFEKKLIEEKNIFEQISHTSPAGITVLDKDGFIIFANNQAEKVLGLTKNKITQRTYSDLKWKISNFDGKPFPIEKLPFQRVKKEKKTIFDIRHAIEYPNGKRVLISINAAPLITPDGEFNGMISTVEDITGKIISEQKLKESEKKYRILFEESPLSIVLLDVNGKIIDCNPAQINMSGFQREEYVGKNWQDINLFPPKYKKIAIKAFEEILKGNIPDNLEMQALRKDGSSIWILLKASPIVLGNNTLLQIITQDITEMKKTQLLLMESEEKFRTLAEQSLIGITILQGNKTKFVNKRFADTIGYPLEEVKNWTLKDHLAIIHPKFADFVHEQIIKKQKGDPDVLEEYEISIYDKNRNLKWIHIFSKTIQFRGQTADLVSFIDISERKIIENELRESESRYKKAYNRAEFYKDLFAHDINNILHNISMGIQLYSKKLKKFEKYENFEDIQHIIKEQVNRGAKLVSNIRKISQIEEQFEPLKPIKLIPILKNSIKFVKNSFKHKSLSIQLQTDIDELIINANDFVQEIFDNILINAIKYTKNPDVLINIHISKVKSNNRNYYKMQFIDNGIGIPDPMKKSVFLRSYHKKGNIGGMGLGLSLVRKIIDTYNGDIWVEDKVKGQPSQGSNFIVLFPEFENIKNKQSSTNLL